MKTRDLIPRAPRRMRQPRKDLLREQLALAATTIEQQRADPGRARVAKRPPPGVHCPSCVRRHSSIRAAWR